MGGVGRFGGAAITGGGVGIRCRWVWPTSAVINKRPLRAGLDQRSVNAVLKPLTMATTYPQRVRDNILPLSVGETLPEAFEEWSFTERTIDNETPIETCQLCDHEELRYQFEIRNALTKHSLLVGSQCILKFNLSVFEDGRRLSPADSKKKLDRLTQKMRLESCIKSLGELAKSEDNEILINALEFYVKNKYLTPKYAFVVFWRLRQNNIDHSPTFFKINIKKQKYKNDLRNMPISRVHVIWPALSSSQRKIAISMGHTSPADEI